MRNFIGNMLLGCVSIALTLAALEATFRLLPLGSSAPSWDDRPKFYYDPAGAKDHTAQTHSPQKPADTFRVAVVGDSFSFGPFLQYDDTFPARLSRMLNQNSATLKAEVINYGIPSYSTSHEVDVVKRALAEGADLVLLQVTLNDAEVKPYRPTGTLVTTNRFGVATLEPEHQRFAFSKFLTFLFNKIQVYQSRQSYRDYFFSLFKNPSGMKLFKDSVSAIERACRKKNVPLVAAVFPLFGAAVDDTYPFDELHELVGSVLLSNTIPVFDLREPYCNIPLSRLQVLPGQDFHPNEIAHRIAAEAIYVQLERSGLIPEELKLKSVFRFRNRVTRTSEGYQTLEAVLLQAQDDPV